MRPTKLADAAVMEAAREPGVAFAAGLTGGYVVPEFVAAYDASAMLVRTLELLATRGPDDPITEIVTEPVELVVRGSTAPPAD